MTRTSGSGEGAMSRSSASHGGLHVRRAERHTGGGPDVDQHLAPGHHHHHLFLRHVGGQPGAPRQRRGDHLVIDHDGGARVGEHVPGAPSGQDRVEEEEEPGREQHRADDAEQQRRDSGRAVR